MIYYPFVTHGRASVPSFVFVFLLSLLVVVAVVFGSDPSPLQLYHAKVFQRGCLTLVI